MGGHVATQSLRQIVAEGGAVADTAGKEHSRPGAEAADEVGTAPGHGADDAGQDRLGRNARRAQADRLRFCKHGAHAADVMGLCPFQQLVELFDPRPQGAGDHLEKAAGTGGALVVHQKVGEVAVAIELDHLAVLAADVDDGVHRRTEQARPQPMTGDLGDPPIGERRQIAAITGQGQMGALRQPGRERLPALLDGGQRTKGGRHQKAANDAPALSVVEQDPLGRGGAGVNPDGE